MNEPPAAPDLTGEWCGRWTSSRSGRSGPLRATFRLLDAGKYQVRFRGRFWAVFPFRYTAVLAVASCEPDRVRLAGAKRLPFFGEFSYDAEASAADFTAHYRARRDFGTFIMTRVSH